MRNYETKIYNYVDKNTGINVVKAITQYSNETIVATAKCSPEDVFDLERGKTIALKRLDLKIAKKRKADMRAWSNFQRLQVKYHEQEKHRAKKALEYAECAVADRQVEIRKLEAELVELTK